MRRRRLVKKLVAKAARGQQPSAVVDGWSLVLSRFPGGGPGWLLSAKLSPYGRGSTELDWERIGEIIAAFAGELGHEPDLLTPLQTTHPNASHYWAFGAPKAEVEHLKQAIAPARSIMNRAVGIPDEPASK